MIRLDKRQLTWRVFTKASPDTILGAGKSWAFLCDFKVEREFEGPGVLQNAVDELMQIS